MEGGWFLTVSHAIDVSRIPPICSFIWTRTSVAFHALQYYSSLLRGTVGRLRLIWQFQGCRSLDEYIRTFPNQVRVIRRMVYLCVAGIHRRHRRTFAKHQWCLFGLADARRRDEHEGVTVPELSQGGTVVRTETSKSFGFRRFVKFVTPLRRMIFYDKFEV